MGGNANVRIRSVQDDRTGESILDAALTGQRNHEDSKRKSEATAAGKRRAVERGESQGTTPDGYITERIPNGPVIERRVLMDPERERISRLIWQMAREGATVKSIVRALNAEGYKTAPRPLQTLGLVLRENFERFDLTRG